jgi:hypothetical protein
MLSERLRTIGLGLLLPVFLPLGDGLAHEESIRELNGDRIHGQVLADGPEYVIVNCCGSPKRYKRSDLRELSYPGKFELDSIEALSLAGRWDLAEDQLKDVKSKLRRSVHQRRITRIRLRCLLGQGRDETAIAVFLNQFRWDQLEGSHDALLSQLYLPEEPDRAARRARFLKRLPDIKRGKVRATAQLLYVEALLAHGNVEAAEPLLKSKMAVYPVAWQLARIRALVEQKKSAEAAAMLDQMPGADVNRRWYRYHYLQGRVFECDQERTQAVLAYLKIGLRDAAPDDVRRQCLRRAIDVLSRTEHRDEADKLRAYLGRSFPYLVIQGGAGGRAQL